MSAVRCGNDNEIFKRLSFCWKIFNAALCSLFCPNKMRIAFFIYLFLFNLFVASLLHEVLAWLTRANCARTLFVTDVWWAIIVVHSVVRRFVSPFTTLVGFLGHLAFCLRRRFCNSVSRWLFAFTPMIQRQLSFGLWTFYDGPAYIAF